MLWLKACVRGECNTGPRGKDQERGVYLRIARSCEEK